MAVKSLVLCLFFAHSWAVPAVGAVRFTDVTSSAGVDMLHDPDGATVNGEALQNWWGPGVGFADLNSDGWLDIFVANGQSGDRLFLNNADGTFNDVSASFNVAGTNSSNGFAAADIDNNGMIDFAVGNFLDQPFLYTGRPEGFLERASTFGLLPVFDNGIVPEGMGVAWGDTDRNGFVDLYVANHRVQPDVFYRNYGGLFLKTTDVSATEAGWGFMALFLDYDEDGDQDIYVANDFGENFLFQNQGPDFDYELIDKAALYKVAGGGNMKPRSMGMGLAAADYDNDLDIDIYVTNYGLNALYDNQVRDPLVRRFVQRAEDAGVQFSRNCWGVDFADLDLDGDLDLIQASGYIFAPAGSAPQALDLPNRVWLNNGDKTFTEASDATRFNDRGMGRGLATGDFDRDGDLDVVITNNTMDHPELMQRFEGWLQLYRNDQDGENHWVNLKLKGGGQHGNGLGCNYSAVGARVYLTSAGLTQMREVQAGASFMSQNSLEVEFGLGAATAIDELRVRWICGVEEVFLDVNVDEHMRLVEGTGRAVTVPITLMSFEAFGLLDGIQLEWITGSSSSASRTRIYRALDQRGDPHWQSVELPIESSGDRIRAFDGNVEPGNRYAYRLELIGTDGIAFGSSVVYATARGASPGVRRAEVGQNFPNPFNPSTRIEFDLPSATDFRLVIYDSRGRQIRELLTGHLAAGAHYADWDGRDDSGVGVASGTYRYVLITPASTSSRAMTLVR
jgi:hypothetical protein